MITALVLAALTAGYALGRWRPAHRASDWANWQLYGKRPTGPRYWAMWTVLSTENIGWLITHPVKGVHAWQHRKAPPPPRSPAPSRNPNWATEHRGEQS
ncbi:hypothetical protein [Streptomyces sp. H27-C3]|uniref:hypothetical protein n=1 Tax=Streptomyces sp. H27-C3 TaxID=3046305 RepID=UPI0024B98C8F|nr:hypothetical protein [Streptomyces sp. H27-C3]MDJ0460628.1 hypothetical protein [Streptomyces sp. H27-C3]